VFVKEIMRFVNWNARCVEMTVPGRVEHDEVVVLWNILVEGFSVVFFGVFGGCQGRGGRQKERNDHRLHLLTIARIENVDEINSI